MPGFVISVKECDATDDAIKNLAGLLKMYLNFKTTRLPVFFKKAYL